MFGETRSMLPATTIVEAINKSPLNRGLNGANWLATEGNIPITFDNGDIALFDDEGDGAYEVHFLFVSRGRMAIDHVREAFRQMFEDYGANLIFGLVPVERKDVTMMARWTGGKFVGVRETSEGPCELYVLSKFMWDNQS